jgi:hypothetical protein
LDADPKEENHPRNNNNILAPTRLEFIFGGPFGL